MALWVFVHIFFGWVQHWYNHFSYLLVHLNLKKVCMVFVFVCVILLHLVASFVPGFQAQLVAFQQLGQASQQRWKLRRIAGALAFGVFWFWLIHASFSCHFATLQVAAALPAKFFCDILNLAQGSFLWQIFLRSMCLCNKVLLIRVSPRLSNTSSSRSGQESWRTLVWKGLMC